MGDNDRGPQVNRGCRGHERPPAQQNRGMGLIDLVVGQTGAEHGGVAIGLARIVEVQGSHVHGGSGDQVVLVGDLVGSMSLRLGTRAKAHAGDAVAAPGGHARSVFWGA